MFSLLCLLFQQPLLGLLGANDTTWAATEAYLYWTVLWGAAPSILNVVLAYMVRSEGASLHASIGTMSGCILNIILDPIFILPQGPVSYTHLDVYKRQVILCFQNRII